ncbi:MAG: lipopolysaccharide kinase InaA family protein [Pirellulales bacterium]
MLRKVGATVARLHDAGVQHGGLDAFRVLVADDTAIDRVGFVDFGSAVLTERPPTRRRRVDDLARLLASLPDELLDDAERTLVVSAYADASAPDSLTTNSTRLSEGGAAASPATSVCASCGVGRLAVTRASVPLGSFPARACGSPAITSANCAAAD